MAVYTLAIIVAIVQLNTTAIKGVYREWLKYEIKFGKCRFLAAAYEMRAAVNADPLAAPNVEHATPSGTINAKSLNTRSPNVIATAPDAIISAGEITVK